MTEGGVDELVTAEPGPAACIQQPAHVLAATPDLENLLLLDVAARLNRRASLVE